MRKYVIKYTRQAYEDKKIDWQDYISHIGCYGVKEFKATIEYLKNTIGLQYIEEYADILSGDGENAYYIGEKKTK